MTGVVRSSTSLGQGGSCDDVVSTSGRWEGRAGDGMVSAGGNERQSAWSSRCGSRLAHDDVTR